MPAAPALAVVIILREFAALCAVDTFHRYKVTHAVVGVLGQSFTCQQLNLFV